MSCHEIFKRKRSVGEDPDALDVIIITHEHQDHIQELQVDGAVGTDVDVEGEVNGIVNLRM